jgi:GNAT superfamily N-acetyltransferase
MPGYRFCRSDDIPLLVDAYNACWVPHFGPASAITADDFKRDVRALGLWSSSCMVAFEADEPIGILLGAKRDGVANCVHRLAVKPGWERRGHGRHLLTSLADKARILGPARLVAEIPSEWTAIRSFFEKTGFVEEARYVDFVRDGSPGGAAGDPRDQLVMPITLDELVESGAFDGSIRRPWARSLASLRAKGDALLGLAVATDRIEAYVLYVAGTDGTASEVWGLGAADGGAGSALLGLLLARLGAVRIVGVSEREVSAATLSALGCTPAGETIGYVTNEA